MRQWRLIYDPPMRGGRNMAADEAISRAVSMRDQLPTLRLYAWSVPCLSLGYGQRSAEVDFERLKAHGWDIVRRKTGGRAVLHIDELTYSVSIPLDDPIAKGSIVESCARISQGLIAAFVRLGAAPRADVKPGGAAETSPICFDTASHYEITVEGKKLVGSAQRRDFRGHFDRPGVLLQHGAIPLGGDVSRICDALVYPDEPTRTDAKALVRERATTVEAVIGRPVTFEAMAHALIAGFESAFDVRFVELGLSPPEAREVAEQPERQPMAWVNRR
ncbi:MAG: biotin/lipoate A/B protein ligase family protein [bacterium]|nr:biotin/lipoate A/B protein ligase family protein [bacterium]